MRSLSQEDYCVGFFIYLLLFFFLFHHDGTDACGLPRHMHQQALFS